MTTENFATPEAPTGPQVGGGAAVDAARGAHAALAATQAALQIWINATRTGCGIDFKSADTLGGAMDAIIDSIESIPSIETQAPYSESLDRVRDLLRIIGMALWNFEGGETSAPDSGDLAETADLALDRLQCVRLDLAGVAGGAQ